MIDLIKDGARWTITLNRPNKANALSLQMLEQLDQIVQQVQDDPSVKTLVITGAGDRVFSAGADLGEARQGADMTTNPVWQRLSARLARLPCLTIAALNGTLAGGAFGLALACDLRLAMPHAKFFYPVLKNGFLPQPADVTRMVNLIGAARTKLILLAGQKLNAETALAIGLIDRIVVSGGMADAIDVFAADVEAAPGHITTAIKRLCDLGLTEAALQDCYSAVYDTDAASINRLRNLD